MPLGGRKAYATVQDHPAEAFLLDIDLMRANAPAMHEEVVSRLTTEKDTRQPAHEREKAAITPEHDTEAQNHSSHLRRGHNGEGVLP